MTGDKPHECIRLVHKLQLGNRIAIKVGQASSPDIIMTSGDACPTYCFESENEIFRKKRSWSFRHRRIPKLELGNERKDTPSGCNNRSPLRKRWVRRNTDCFSPVGAIQPLRRYLSFVPPLRGCILHYNVPPPPLAQWAMCCP